MAANLRNERFFLSLINSGKLKVTKSGKAFNLISGKEVAKTPSSKGYRKLSWQDPNSKKIRQIQLHRLVWAHFKGIPEDSELQLNHRDGIKANCRLTNLELTTNSGNVKHALATGLRVDPRGELRPNSKFLDSEVKRLRKYFSEYELSHHELAEELDVHPLTLFSMLRGDTYSHVKSSYTKICRTLLPKLGRGRKLT
jgi:hypothetical protein